MLKYLTIKYFPSNKQDYIGHFFFYFFFSIVFTINIPFLNKMLFSNTENSYILLIPKLDNTFEEKKDLIFSRLSLNENIITVKEIDKKIIVNKLKQQIEINNIEENLIPEVFEIILKKNSKMELGKETKTLREILPEAEILKKITEKQALTLINYLFFYISLFIFFTTLIILQNNFVSKINSFLTRSRIFGVSDTEVIFKVSVGYLFFQFLGTLTALLIMYSIETEYKSLEIFTIKNLKALVIFFCIFSILCFYLHLKSISIYPCSF